MKIPEISKLKLENLHLRKMQLQSAVNQYQALDVEQRKIIIQVATELKMDPTKVKYNLESGEMIEVKPPKEKKKNAK